MDISIIILNYKSKGLGKQCLKGIEACQLKLKYEIIVVDNASKDETVDMIKEEFPRVKIIVADKNQGFAAGMNLGLKIAKGKYYLLLNPDVAVMQGSIMTLYSFMEKLPVCGAPKYHLDFKPEDYVIKANKKPLICSSCKYYNNNYCIGVSPTYLRLYGEKDLIPQ